MGSFLILFPDPTDLGTLSWNTTGVALGNYNVRLRVSDTKGGTADQVFVITVKGADLNYPPVFISTPVVNASVATLYTYPAAVLDADNDTQTFSVVSGPTGLSIDPNTGLVQWTPTTAGGWPGVRNRFAREDP